MERPGHRGYESGVKRTVDHESNRAVWSMKRRFAILLAACVLISGCGVRSGMEKVEDAKDAKQQAEKQAHDLEKKLQEGQEDLEEGQ